MYNINDCRIINIREYNTIRVVTQPRVIIIGTFRYFKKNKYSDRSVHIKTK